jgi:hypothetical protein
MDLLCNAKLTGKKKKMVKIYGRELLNEMYTDLMINKESGDSEPMHPKNLNPNGV